MSEQKKQRHLWTIITISTIIVAGVITCIIVKKQPTEQNCISMWSQVASIVSRIEGGDDPNALVRIDKLIANFKDQPGLVAALWLAGQEYYNKAARKDREGFEEQARNYYRKAITLREKIIQELSPSAFTAPAYYTAAVIYSQELHEYSEAIEYYQKVVDNWPDYKYAWHAQYFIGMYYEKLRDSGGISASKANPKIEAAYRAVIENYPDSSSAKHAARKLDQMNYKKPPMTAVRQNSNRPG